MRPGRFGKEEAVIKVVEKDGKYPKGYVTIKNELYKVCLLYTSPSPRDRTRSRMPSSA